MTPSSSTGHTASTSPRLVLWEAWREADPARRWRDDLSTMEAMRLMNEVRCFGRIAFQLVGRPLRRADVMLLVEHGARIGLGMRLAPGADPLTPELLASLRDAGLQRVVLDSSLRAPAVLQQEIERARSLGLGVHVTTRVTPLVLEELAARGRELVAAGVHVWTLGFGVEGEPVLRGAALDAALERVLALARGLRLQLEIEGAPQVRRVLYGAADAELLGLAPAEGHSLLFVGADGSLLPAPHLPLVLGNVRHDDVVDVFREAPELCALRDPDQLHGRCGACEFRFLCGGGSRARAYAATGDWLAPDPACSYQPPPAAREAAR